MIVGRTLNKCEYLIVDGYYMAYRAYTSTPPLTNSQGFPTGAIHGFMGSLLSLIKDLRPSNVVIAVEGGSGDREEQNTDYKANRKDFPEDLKKQLPIIFGLCNAFGLTVVGSEGKEADDVIASICHQNKDVYKVIFTTDKDLFTLVDDKCFIAKKVKGKTMLWTAPDVKEKWGVNPQQIKDVLCLSGDSIDNVKGVPGIGLKTAVKLINEFGSSDNVYSNLDKVPKTTSKKLIEGKESYIEGVSLITMDHELDLPNLSNSKPNKDALEDLYAALEMKSSKERWFNFYEIVE